MKSFIPFCLLLLVIEGLFAQNLNGVYINSKKQQLIISKHLPGHSFEFTVKWGVNDEWDCMNEAQGIALIKEGFAYYSEDLSSAIESPQIRFTILANKLMIDPSNYVSMNCLKFGDSNSDTYCLFTKTSAGALPIIKASASSQKYRDWGPQPTEAIEGPTDPWSWPNIYCSGPSEEDVRVSSTLAPQGNFNYHFKNLCDDNPKSAWVEGSPDYGIGEFIEFKRNPFNSDGVISILNGYQWSRSSWENNSRVKKLKVSIQGKDICIIELSDVMGSQRFTLPQFALKMLEGGESVRFTIVDVYPGLKWKDTAISGIYSCVHYD